ncbi:YheC/D like ATP-grasp [Paenibacillus sp. UNCCL117]|uniref:YheC/YheD family protein n=1 Tax=unclassified Paenibacillus TaxID=185978 RepID=UPI00088ADB7E|nr:MULTISPECIES: YheC/YheD family protein [unclassified Paenibacillus]SDC46153.1 YheC/D like ATP-grasp [Paenibacillus sp. cl123]SFW12358.1 YheC/D like ATP-grasp [Paenibacillus sp. UNCCL117]
MGKLGKHNFMKKYNRINTVLPDTRAATKANLVSMINKYDSLYLKPNVGTGGFGIYKIIKKNNSFILKSGTRSTEYKSFQALYGSIQRVVSKKKYVVQKGIDLLKHEGRPFDIRVMVQKNRNRQLETTGIIGRLAKRNKIVTNYHNGGTPMKIDSLLKSHLRGSQRASVIKKIESLGREASVVLGKSLRGNKAFGVDIAIDSKMKPWVLEVNTRPDMSIFNTLKDKTMYRKILKYSKF